MEEHRREPEDVGDLAQLEEPLLDNLDISYMPAVAIQMEPPPSTQEEPIMQEDDNINELRSLQGEISLETLIAMNEAMQDLIDIEIGKANEALRANLDKQRVLSDRKHLFNKSVTASKKKVPVVMFMPPYFKDRYNMCPPQNEEAKRKLDCMIYDPLLREEKKWNEIDLQKLKEAVRNSLIEERLLPIYGQRDLIHDKIREADATTTPEERKEWNEKLEGFERKIDYEKSLSDKELFTGDYRNVDWATIAMVHFKGQRTPSSLRLKWCNEQSPEWAKGDWTAAEVKKLNELKNNNFVSWSLVAAKLGTKRTPWQCFEKYKSEISSEILKREWSKEEDDRLVELVNSLQLNGIVQWDKVTYHMPGRTRQQVRMRYMRTLDKSIRHGRWTDEEDLLLMCSIGRYGAKDWRKIAKGVPTRNDGQCRERWVNVLDRANRCEEWTMEEDERLLYAVNMYGKGQWARVAKMLPGRTEMVAKSRFRSLMTTKMRICAAQLAKIHDAQEARRQSGNRYHLNMKRKKCDETEEDEEGDEEEEGPRRRSGGRERQITNVDRKRSVSQMKKLRVKGEDPEVRRAAEKSMRGIAKKVKTVPTSLKELRKKQRWLPVVFGPDVDELGKRERITEALCQVIGKHDQQHWLAAQSTHRVKLAGELEQRLKEILVDGVAARVRKVMKGEKKEEEKKVDVEEDEGPCSSKEAAERNKRESASVVAVEKEKGEGDEVVDEKKKETTMQPTTETMHAAEMMMAELPRLAKIAAPLLAGDWSGESNPQLLSMEDVLERLDAHIGHQEEYVELRELLRSLLFDPLSLVCSLEKEEMEMTEEEEGAYSEEFLSKEYYRARDSLMAEVETEAERDEREKKEREERLANPKKRPVKRTQKDGKKGRGRPTKKKRDESSEESEEEEEEEEEDGAPTRPTSRPFTLADALKGARDAWNELPADWLDEEKPASPEKSLTAEILAVAHGRKKEKKETTETHKRKAGGADTKEKEGEEEMLVTTPSARESAARKTAAKRKNGSGGGEARKEEEKGGKKSKSSKSAPPKVEGSEEEEEEVVKPPPVKKGRTSRNSLGSADNDELARMLKMIESFQKKEKGRARKSIVALGKEEKKEEKVETKKKRTKKDTVVEEKKEESTVAGEEQEKKITVADDAMEGEKDTEAAEETIDKKVIEDTVAELVLMASENE